MSKFRTGSFDRQRVSSVLHPFLPAHAVASLLEVNIDQLWEQGKRLILLDVDHTIVKWRAEEFPEGIEDWIQKAKEKGFSLCILSNTRNPERLARLAARLQIETVRDKFKPSPAMFRLAMIKFKCKPEETIMIGDQIFTDILGANRSGIDAIWVQKMEGKEFAGTKISRFGERLLRSALYKALVTPVDETPEPPEIEVAKPIWERAIFRQFLKFCVVGVTSFIVDLGTRWILMFMVPWKGGLLSEAMGRWFHDLSPRLFAIEKGPSDAAVPIITVIAASLAIFNSFIWNRRWTFKIKGKEERLTQLRRFYTVSLVGLVLNTLVTKAFYGIVPGHPKQSLAVATMIAAAIVAVWNFTGQRVYAFRSNHK